MKFILISWQDEIIHFDRTTGDLKALSKVTDNESTSPLFIDKNGFILNTEIDFSDIKITIHGNYNGIFNLKDSVYYSARRNGVVRPWKAEWNKWEQFFSKPYELFNDTTKTALQNLNIKKINYKNRDATNQKIPKIIWMFWDGDTMPAVVKACFENIKKLNPSYDVRICNSKNLKQYIDIEFNEDIEMTFALKSDLIRLNLLDKHGGVWVDASTIFTASLDDMFGSIQNYNENDLIAFYSEKFNSENIPVIESWFLASPPNSAFIKEWLKIFEPVKNLGLKKYIQELSQRSGFNSAVEKVSDPEYLAVYVAAIMVMQEKKNTSNIFLWNSNFSAFAMQYQFHWDQNFIMSLLCKADINFVTSPKTPILKLTKSSRKAMDSIMEKKQLRENSFIYKFLKENKALPEH